MQYSQLILHVNPNASLSAQVLENSLAVDPTAVKNPQAWVQSWTTVISGITKNPVAAPRIIISPLGNPDARGLKCDPAFLETYTKRLQCRTGHASLQDVKTSGDFRHVTGRAEQGTPHAEVRTALRACTSSQVPGLSVNDTNFTNVPAIK